jgi:hypothetical protein
MTGLFSLFYLCYIALYLAMTVPPYGASADIFVTEFRDRVKRLYPCYFGSSPVALKFNKNKA